jgi:hypothetical protein
LGWYSTKSKPGENPKDIYITVVFHFWPGYIKERIENENLEVYITGGATQKLMMTKGTDKNLKMYGATYRVINPITDGMTIDELCNVIIHELS